MKAKVLVVAPEGGGNHLLQGLLRTHPSLKKEDVIGTSLASGRLGYWISGPVEDRYKGLGFWMPVQYSEKADKVVLSTRSPVHAAYSAWVRFGECTNGGLETCIWYQFIAPQYIKMLELSPYPTITTSYEKLVKDTEGELNKIASFLGLSTNWRHADFSTKPDYDWGSVINRNDDRWKEDKTFCETWDKYKEMFDVLTT